MLRAGVKKPAQLPLSTPVVLDLESDGSLHFCVDYRRLNSIIIWDTYPISQVDDWIEFFGEATVFTALDATLGHWRVSVRKQNRDKTAFLCHSGSNRFKGMPFGLKNAPATF